MQRRWRSLTDRKAKVIRAFSTLLILLFIRTERRDGPRAVVSDRRAEPPPPRQFWRGPNGLVERFAFFFFIFINDSGAPNRFCWKRARCGVKTSKTEGHHGGGGFVVVTIILLLLLRARERCGPWPNSRPVVAARRSVSVRCSSSLSAVVCCVVRVTRPREPWKWRDCNTTLTAHRSRSFVRSIVFFFSRSPKIITSGRGFFGVCFFFSVVSPFVYK